MKFREVLKGWNEYWFGYGSPSSLGVFRILFGFLATANLLMLMAQFADWFTEQGYVPLAVGERMMPGVGTGFRLFGWETNLPFEPPRLNFLAGVVDPRVTFAVLALTTLAAIFTTLGLWTRLSTILLAVGVVSLHHRNGLILHGGDTVLRVGVLYLALAPSGAACSLDRLIALWKGRATAELPKVSLWPQRLIAFNVALVYFTTFWHKFGFGDRWRDFTATYYPAHLNEFRKFPVPEFIGQPPVIYVTTAATLIVELALGTLVFYKPLRKWVLLSGLGLHAFIEYSMNIPLFAFLICSMYVAFYEGEEVEAWAKRLGERFRKFRTTLHVPKGQALKPGPALALRALDPLGLVDISNGKDEAFAPQEMKRAWKRSLGAWPFGWIPGVWRSLLASAIEPRGKK